MLFPPLTDLFRPKIKGPATLQKRIGNWAEELAARELQKKGYRIKERNWMNGADELDVIAMDEGVMVFVEVRARKHNARVPGAQTLGAAKRKALRRVATAYLRTLPEEVGWRFDVVEVSYESKDKFELTHYEGVEL